MPITPFLNGDITFDPEGETRHGRRIRNGSRVALGLEERDHLVSEMVAKRIIELAKTGERGEGDRGDHSRR